jgi:hypothetical protein
MESAVIAFYNIYPPGRRNSELGHAVHSSLTGSGCFTVQVTENVVAYHFDKAYRDN